MMRLFGRKGQSTGEYAIVLGLVVAAAIAMQTYVKRGMEGKIAKAVNNISTATGGTTVQYEPYYAESDFTTTTNPYSMQEQTVDGGGFSKYLGSAAPSGSRLDKTDTRSGSKTTDSYTGAD
jgi:hypothetical protein